MSKQKLRVISINFPFASADVVQEPNLATSRALFDFDVVVVRPPQFSSSRTHRGYELLSEMIDKKQRELTRLFAKGGILVVFLDLTDTYTVDTHGGYSEVSVNNYEFLGSTFARCLQGGAGNQISYSDPTDPFVAVLKNSSIAWTAYVASTPANPFNNLRFFAQAGVDARVAGKMPYGEGYLILLPNLARLDEDLFFEACADYRFKRQGTKPPDWADKVFLPGIAEIESEVADFDNQIQTLRVLREQRQQLLDEKAAYRKLLYEKGTTQLEPAV